MESVNRMLLPGIHFVIELQNGLNCEKWKLLIVLGHVLPPNEHNVIKKHFHKYAELQYCKLRL